MATERRYLSCAETAKLVRVALKREFPGVKFSVRSDTYSGGASIRVRWADGPTESSVDAVVGVFSGADFDGSIDLKSYNEHWLEADGTVTLAHERGTASSKGCLPETFGSRRTADAELVSLGADFIFTDRALSAEFLAEVEASLDRPAVAAKYDTLQCQRCYQHVESGWVVTSLHRGHRSDRFACPACAVEVHASSVDAAR